MKNSKRMYVVLVALMALTMVSGQAFAQGTSDPGKTGINIDNPSVHEGGSPGETCTGAGGTNCPAAIPDGPGGVLVSTFDAVSCGGGLIEDVNVGVDIVHTWIGDLDITVTSPAGTSALLYDTDCGSNDDMQAIWDDEGGAYPCPPVGFGNWVPAAAGSLTAMIGEEGDGNWQISITDNAGADTGTLEDWSLEMTCSAPVPTTSQYGLALFAVLLALAGLGAMAMKRRGLSH